MAASKLLAFVGEISAMIVMVLTLRDHATKKKGYVRYFDKLININFIQFLHVPLSSSNNSHLIPNRRQHCLFIGLPVLRHVHQVAIINSRGLAGLSLLGHARHIEGGVITPR